MPLYGAGELPQAFARLAVRSSRLNPVGSKQQIHCTICPGRFGQGGDFPAFLSISAMSERVRWPAHSAHSQAVGGALYVLRCPITGILLQGHPDIASGAAAAAEKAATDAAKAAAEAEKAAVAEASAEGEASAGGSAGQGPNDAAPPSKEEDQPQRPPAPPAPVEAQRAVRLRGGQVVRCATLVGNGPHLNPLLQHTAAAAAATALASALPQRWVSRAVCLLDGPLTSDLQQALLVVPPGTPMGDRAILAMQLGPASAVVPQACVGPGCSLFPSGASLIHTLVKKGVFEVHDCTFPSGLVEFPSLSSSSFPFASPLPLRPRAPCPRAV